MTKTKMTEASGDPLPEYCKGSDLIERAYWLTQVHADKSLSWPAFHFAFAISAEFDRHANGFATIDQQKMAPRLGFAYDVKGERFTAEGEGLYARAMQHEHDHLIGRLLIDQVGPIKKQMIKRKLEKAAKLEAEEEAEAEAAAE